MVKEAEQQKFCITRELNQVPLIGPLDTIAVIAFIGALRLIESLPYINAKSSEKFQELKTEATQVLSMAIMSLEVKLVAGRGWIVPANHPLVAPITLEEMKRTASQVHKI